MTDSTPTAEADIVVAGISGSLREGSRARMALELALEGAAETGVSTRLIDLRDYELTFCDGKEDDDESPPDVVRLRQAVRSAHGLLLATPEYHGSFSGVLKNAIDLMGFSEFEGKMIGLIGVSGGRLGALDALNGLRTVGRVLHAWVTPNQVGIPDASRVFTADGTCTDDEIAARLRGVGRDVARFAWLHGSEKTREFIREWENAPVNPGGD